MPHHWSVAYCGTVTIIVAVSARDAFRIWRTANPSAGRDDVTITRAD